MHNEGLGSRHPAKAGIQAIGQTNLDSRVRGNDESRRGACSGMPSFML